MKKTRLIGLATLLMSLGMSACLTSDPGKTNTEEDGYVATDKGHYKIENGERGPLEDHDLVPSQGDKKHVPVEATCDKVGKAFKECRICGRFVEEMVPALGHDLQDNGGTTATCESAGVVNLKCSRCDYTKTENSNGALGHQWGTETTVNEKVKKAPCTRSGCNRVEYVVDVGTAGLTLASGSSWKSGNNPESGSVKLNGDGQSFSFTFNLPNGFTGKMYQRAYMDNYSSNSSKKAFYETDSTANIEVLVNSNKVDLSSQNTVTFEQLFKDETDGSNTVFKDILLGDVTLGTANTISYKRVKTLNMTVSTFVFVGSENA